MKGSFRKSLLSLIMAVTTLLTAVPISAAAEGLPGEKVGLYFEPTSLQTGYYNAIFLNGEFYDYIKSASAQTIEVPKSSLKEGANTVTFICGSSATKTYYDETVAPETRNHNDPKVKNLKITVDGTEFIPSTVTGHYITDQKIPAVQSSRTESTDYKTDTNYVFGDGAPGGSPHPASLTIPYKIDFAFTLSGIESSEPVEPYVFNLEENQVYSGMVTVAAAAASETENLKLLVDGQEITAKGSKTASFRYSSSGIQANDGNHFQNGFYLNGTLADILNEDKPEILLTSDQLQYGKENIIALTIGNGSNPYDDTKTPGSINHDDFQVSNFQLVLPDSQVLAPEQIITYRAKDKNTPAATECIRTEETYSTGTIYKMGDGYPAGSDLSMYYKIELVFQVPEINPLIRYYALDTSAFSDGSHTVALSVDGDVKNSTTVFFDNEAPQIRVNFENGACLADGCTVSAEAVDTVSEVVSINAELNGQTVTLPYTASMEELGGGKQYLTVRAADNQGNQGEALYTFSLKAAVPGYGTINGQDSDGTYTFQVGTDPAAEGPLTVAFCGADSLETTVLSGISSNIKPELLDVSGAETAEAGEDGLFTETSSDGLPYQLYKVNVGDKTGTLRLSVSAGTTAGETLVLLVYNPASGLWEILDRQKSEGESMDFCAEITAEDYVENGIVCLAVAPFLVENGNDTLAWVTDTQYYTQRQELIDAKIYENMMLWLKEQYDQQKISYICHTGDIVETSSSESQFIIASEAQNILDEAKVPNGVVAGNHDVGADIANLKYSLYQKYFGAFRYQGQDWYGGSFGNNTSHYDLVTVGGSDMIILYLGMGKEATPETVAWANDVLSQYRHRTAILALHEYLNPQADFITYARGAEIFEKIIVPNANVAMVLCGHDPGASRNVRQVPGTDRQVVEILSDYQAQTNGGDGFLRLLTFKDGQVTNETYSPITGKDYSFSQEKDAFTLALDMMENHRTVSAGSLSAAVIRKEEPFAEVQTEAGGMALTTMESRKVDFSGWYAVVTDAAGRAVRTVVVPVEKRSIEPEETEPEPTEPGETDPSIPDGSQKDPAVPGCSQKDPVKPEDSAESSKDVSAPTGQNNGQNGSSTGNGQSPNTGDAGFPGLLLVMSLLSGSVLLFLYTKRKTVR